MSFHVGLAPAALHSITPNEMRGQVIALYFFILNLVALALGSYIIASVTQYYFMDNVAVGKSVALVGATAHALGIILLIAGMKAYNRAVAELKLK
jgi:hypothetical protein